MHIEEIKQSVKDNLLTASNELEGLASPEADELNQKLLAFLTLLK